MPTPIDGDPVDDAVQRVMNSAMPSSARRDEQHEHARRNRDRRRELRTYHAVPGIAAVSHCEAACASDQPITSDAMTIFDQRDRDSSAVEPADPAPEQHEQRERVEHRRDGRAEREPAIAHHADERQVQREVHATEIAR